MQRCSWADGSDEVLRRYHDEEYGRRKHGDTALFEKLCLECFQAGLSWRTVLYKREALRQCFFGFDAARMAAMTLDDTETLMGDVRIIRCRRKIEAVIANARRQVELFAAPGSFEAYVYGFNSGEALSKDLKRLGYAFAGPVICEAFLQSVGAIEGHEPHCELHGGVR
jgi:DNA-3-methyladenine glycosylase I